MPATPTTISHETPDLGSPKALVVMLVTALVVFLVGALLASERSSEEAGLAMIVLGSIVFVVANIYFFVLLYRVWKYAINESMRHNLIPSIATPGRAVGFLFIPIYGWYWVFKAFGNLPVDLNAISIAKDSPQTMSEGLGVALAILAVLGVIPIVGYVTAVVSLIISPIFISQAVRVCKSWSSVTGVATPA